MTERATKPWREAPEPCRVSVVHRDAWCPEIHEEEDDTEACCFPQDGECGCGHDKPHVHCVHGAIIEVA